MDTDKDEAILMVLGGMSISSIAEELEISPSTVYGWLLNSNISEQLRQHRNESIVAMYEEEQPVHAICQQAQVSVGTVYRILHQHGIEMRRTIPEHSNDVDELIVAAYRAGETLTRVRMMAKRSLTYIYKVLDSRLVPRRR